jgi:glycosyltransferase involved in cell wall biosynthesis
VGFTSLSVRVTFLTHYYPPEVGAPQARISGLARALERDGVEVTVHTCFPHYPDGAIQPPYRNRPWLSEEDGGVRVVRSIVYPAPNRGFARRLANHASFALSALAAAPRTGPADVVVVETPPLFLAGAAIGYARLKRAPLIVHVADLWPDSAVELGALRRPGMIAAARGIERACYRSAAAIVCPTEGIRATLAARPDAGSKVERIGPSVDVERFAEIEELAGEPTGSDEPFRALYAGTLGMAQGVDILIEAAALLEGRERIEVVIAGGGAEEPIVRQRLAERGPDNVRMVGPIPHERIPALIAESEAAVVLLRDRPLFRGALPTKMLEAMSAARPIVLSAAGEAAELVERAQCGVVVPPERPERLAAALAELAHDRPRARRLGAAGRAAAESFSGEAAAERWRELLGRLRVDEP